MNSQYPPLLGLVALFLCLHCSVQAQELIGEFVNPSFEDTAREDQIWPFGTNFPYGWWGTGCRHNGIDNSPNWQPGHRNLQFPAQDGNRYMAMLTRPRGFDRNGVYSETNGFSEESTGQNFQGFVLEDNTEYFFSMYLANNLEGSTYAFGHGRCKLAVYIHSFRALEFFLTPDRCFYTEDEKMWESPLIEHADWRKYYVHFSLPDNFTGTYLKIDFKVEWIEDSSETGNVLIDNLSPIYKGALPQIELGNDTILCVGDTLSWNLADERAPFAQYEWEDGSTNPSRTITESGQYSVRAYGEGFELYDTIRVSYEELLQFDIGADTMLCEGDEFNRTVNIAPDVYQVYWQESIRGNSYTLTGPGVYDIQVLGEACLLARDTLVILPANCSPTFIMSNIFTPNDDQINDRFLPVEIVDITQPFIRVWDRWGRICYESRDLMSGWDGTLKGKPCREGVYYWQCEFGNLRGDRFLESGTVTLLR